MREKGKGSGYEERIAVVLCCRERREKVLVMKCELLLLHVVEREEKVLVMRSE